MRSTLTDIAREAGVSPATVDRVLNNRPGVRARTREIVLEMAQRLGYIAEGPNGAPPRPLPGEVIRLDFALPAGTNSFIKHAATATSRRRRRRGPISMCILPPSRASILTGCARLLQDLRGQTQGVGVIALDHPTVREAIRSLSANDIKVVTIASDILHVPQGRLYRYRQPRGRTAGGLSAQPLHGIQAVRARWRCSPARCPIAATKNARWGSAIS